MLTNSSAIIDDNSVENAPVALFVYNRLWHTQQTIESLKKNKLAESSELIIYSDAEKNLEALSAVNKVREYLRTITGFKSVNIIEREKNYGLAASIIDGVTNVVNQHGKIIVLEDDMVTSPHFLKYMNDAIECYINEPNVASIHGYIYPLESADELPETFFIEGADCWGWATWRDAWACFNPDGQFLFKELIRRKLLRAFNFNGTYPYLEMLEGQINGVNDSWAVRWYASAFLAGKLTLYPRHSLVHNIGNDNSGTHCGESNNMDVALNNIAIDLKPVPTEPFPEARQAFELFFRSNRTGWLKRIFSKVRNIERRIFR